MYIITYIYIYYHTYIYIYYHDVSLSFFIHVRPFHPLGRASSFPTFCGSTASTGADATLPAFSKNISEFLEVSIVIGVALVIIHF